jgi:hypothetical protein
MKTSMLNALVAVLAWVGLPACNPNSIGRPCVNPTGVAPLGVQVASPALECPSRLCLLQPTITNAGGQPLQSVRATCTAGCATDADCDAETQALCTDNNGVQHNYVCAVVTAVGTFCCKKLCMCPLDLQANFNKAPDGGVQTPPECDPAQTPNSTCHH